MYRVEKNSVTLLQIICRVSILLLRSQSELFVQQTTFQSLHPPLQFITLITDDAQ